MMYFKFIFLLVFIYGCHSHSKTKNIIEEVQIHCNTYSSVQLNHNENTIIFLLKLEEPLKELEFFLEKDRSQIQIIENTIIVKKFNTNLYEYKLSTPSFLHGEDVKSFYSKNRAFVEEQFNILVKSKKKEKVYTIDNSTIFSYYWNNKVITLDTFSHKNLKAQKMPSPNYLLKRE